MVKKISLVALCIVIMLVSCGCWDYISLNELAIVTGISIDFEQESHQYIMNFEIVDTAVSSPEKGVQTKIVNSSGQTMFEAVTNAKTKLDNRIYFGVTEVIILSKEVIQGSGINKVIDFFLRVSEARETVYLAVSEEETAAAILESEYTDNRIISQQIASIINNDNKVTLSTVKMPIYEAYNVLRQTGKTLTLPLLKNGENNGEHCAQVDGLVAVKSNKIYGKLSPQYSRYYLFIVNAVEGGTIDFSNEGNLDVVSTEIQSSDTKYSYSINGDQIEYTIKLDIDVFLHELITKDGTDVSTKQAEKFIEDFVSKKVLQVVSYAQKELKTDIFGFGQYIYQHDNKKWDTLKTDWNSTFNGLKVKVEPNVTIINTEMTK